MGLLRSQKKLDPPYLCLTLTHHAIFVKNRSYVAGGLAWLAHLTKLLFLEMMCESQNVNKENLILFC